MLDVAHQISAVRRTVGTHVFEAGEARIVTVSQTYNADVEDVWDACTNPERLPRWFLQVSGDLRVGGKYQLDGNASGTIERCDPPKSFFATWEYGGETSWIEVRIAPAPNGKTKFELEHIAQVEDEKWADYGPGAVGVGWDLAIYGLAVHLTDPESTMTPEQAMAWAMTPEGITLMTESSERWYEANVTAGTDEGAARAAADRTTAFYTTPEPPTPN